MSVCARDLCVCVYVCVVEKSRIILCDAGRADTAASTCICLATRLFLFVLSSGGDYNSREQKQLHVLVGSKFRPRLMEQKRVAGASCVINTSRLAGT